MKSHVHAAKPWLAAWQFASTVTLRRARNA
jgi:hypothetical protein